MAIENTAKSSIFFVSAVGVLTYFKTAIALVRSVLYRSYVVSIEMFLRICTVLWANEYTILIFIATCFGGVNLTSTDGLSTYTARWRSREDRVEFVLMGRGQGWVGIGFSHNNMMVTILFAISIC